MKELPSSTKMDDANFSRTYRHLVVPPSVTVADLTRPGFWVHHAAKLNRFDIIDAIASDGSLDVQLRVDLVQAGLPTMRVLREYVREGRMAETEAADERAAPAGYLVDQDAAGGWRARTKNPVIVLASGLLTKDEAMKAALDHAAKAGVPDTAFSPVAETPALRAAVGIPENWKDMSWQDRRSLASKLTDEAIHNGDEANAAIEAELARRTPKAA